MRKNIIEIAKSLFAYNRANLLTVNNFRLFRQYVGINRRRRL